MIYTVYVTGCCGFIGRYVTLACLNQGYYVIGVDKLTYAANPDTITEFKTYGDHFKFIKSDINELDSLYDCEYVINLAAESHVDNSIINSKEFLHSNINGVQHLLELIRQKARYKMPTLLHFSSDETYGDIAVGSHIETDLLKPSNPYSATKAAADMLITAWARTFNIPHIIVRPTNNYGIGQYTEKLLPMICKTYKLGKKLLLHNNGSPTRIWLHAKDTADAIITIINSNIQNEIYNISGNIEITNLEMVKKVLTYIDGYPPTKSLINDFCDFSYKREGQDVRYSLNDTKLRNLGWNNKCNLDNELPSIVEYYKNKFIW